MDWIDPLGLANLNYFNQTTDPNLYQLAQQWNPSDTYSIAGHGLVDQNLNSLNQIVLPNGQTLNAQQLAQLIRQDPKWNGKPIEIRGCSLGQGDDSFAQQLANLLKTKVTAGTREEMWTSFRVPFTSILLDLGISFPLGGQPQVFIPQK